MQQKELNLKLINTQEDVLGKKRKTNGVGCRRTEEEKTNFNFCLYGFHPQVSITYLFHQRNNYLNLIWKIGLVKL